MDKANFRTCLEVGADSATIKQALQECGYNSIDAVPENDRPRVAAKALARSAAFARVAAKFPRDVNAFALAFWNQRRPQAERPTEWDAVSKLAWDNLNQAAATAKAGGDDGTGEHD